MKILLLDNNTDYAQRLKYFFEKKYHDMQIVLCDNIDSVNTVMVSESIDIVLFDAAFDDAQQEIVDAISKKSVFAYISSTDEIVNNCDTIYKYKSVTDIHTKICGLYEKRKNRIIRHNDDKEKNDKKTEIITFIPVHGGAGSSTIAAACAASLSKEYPVLYLNFEQRSSAQVFFRGECDKGLSDLVAALKTKYTENGIYQLMKEIIQQDKAQTFANPMFINGYRNIMDCMSMNAQCVTVILDMIKRRFGFRYVIIDTDCIVSDVMKCIVTSSDKLVFVSSGSDTSNIKMTKLVRYLEIIKREADNIPDKKYLIMNQYYGTVDNAPVMSDMKVLAALGRYRTDEKGRVSSQTIINEILGKEGFFRELID